MALTPMNDYVDGMDHLRVAMGYGLPKQYPLGMNGFGADDPLAASLGPFAFDSNTAFSPPSQIPRPSNQINISTPFNATAHPPDATPFGQKVNTVTDAITKIAAAFGPAFKKAPKQKVVIQKDPDYTTYAIIGGAVIVASVLAIAVGKSGRRKD